MTDEVVTRIHEWLPPDLTDPAEVLDAVEGTGWSRGWTKAVVDEVADGVAGRRTVETPEVLREKRGAEGPMGPADPGRRQVQVRAADGSVLGKPENVATWEDRWGNVIGRNRETGTQKVVRRKEDR